MVRLKVDVALSCQICDDLCCQSRHLKEDEGCYSIEATKIMLFMGKEGSSFDYYCSIAEAPIIFVEKNE